MIDEDNDLRYTTKKSAFGTKLFGYSIRFKFLEGILSRGVNFVHIHTKIYAVLDVEQIYSL